MQYGREDMEWLRRKNCYYLVRISDFFAQLSMSFEMQDAVGELDMDTVDTVLEQLASYQLDPHDRALLEQLREASADFDAETCETLIIEWMQREEPV